MNDDELKAVFDQLAPNYDQQWIRMAPMREGLYFQLDSVFADLPDESRVLCVGVGTGTELAHLAHRFPGWCFTAVDPSGPMLEVCRRRAEAEGFAARCRFHEGYVASLPPGDPHHGATCFLVSQFILERDARSEFFRAIAEQLQPGGMLASADLAAAAGPAFEALLRAWMNMMAGGGLQAEALARMREAYGKDVAVLPPATVASIIESGGFEPPVQFFQAGLLHAWMARCDAARPLLGGGNATR